MKKRLFLSGMAALAGAFALVATGSAGVAKKAAHQVTPLPASSCAPIYYEGSGSPKYIIASDLPLQGSGRTQTIEMTKAIKFILKQHGFKAGNNTIGYQSCDDATAQAGKWESGKCSANAAAYAADADVIGVIGTFNSGCAEIIVPVLNRAPNGPLGMVSPANTYVGLTKTGPGTVAGEPGKYYPTGKRNYIRIVANDAFQGAADAILAQQLGVKKIYILNDKEAYGHGVASNFKNAATKLGLNVVGFSAWDGKASSYEALAVKIKDSGANGVFLGGLVCENGGKLIKDLRAGLGAGVKLIAPDGFTPISAVVTDAGDSAEGVTVSVAGLPNAQLKGAGSKFVAGFSKTAGKEPDPYSVYSAQAAEVLLAAIANSDGSRASVAKNLFKTSVKSGILGDFTIDPNGDTSGAAVTMSVIKGGKGVFLKVITPPASLVKIA